MPSLQKPSLLALTTMLHKALDVAGSELIPPTPEQLEKAAEWALQAGLGLQRLATIQAMEAAQLWVIYSSSEYIHNQDDAGFWSMSDGWTTLAGATRFTDADTRAVQLPTIGNGDAHWLKLTDAIELIQKEQSSRDQRRI